MVDSTDVSGWTPLNHAPQRGDSDMVKLLLAANAKVDLASKSGTTALITAVKHGHREAVKLLLDANAEINIKDIDGTTAITWATKSGGGFPGNRRVTRSGSFKAFEGTTSFVSVRRCRSSLSKWVSSVVHCSFCHFRT